MIAELIRPGHVIRAAELLSQILTDDKMPADARMDQYFKAHKEMGKRDRGVVAELTYSVLRHCRMIDARLGEMSEGWPGYQRRVGALLMIQQGISMRGLEKYMDETMAKEVAEALRATPATSLPNAVRYSIPDSVWQAWEAQWGEAETIKLAQSLLSAAPADIRVNSLKATQTQVQQSLADAGFELTTIDGVTNALRQAGRAPLFRTDAFQQGWFEMQDAGSQVIGALLPVASGQKVVDFCAGAGGKTLQLAAAMQNKGSLIACDVSQARLNRMRPRLARAGVDNVRIMPLTSETETRLKKLRGSQDAVLVDAPCSGSGTWRRSPDMKWRNMELTALNATQLSVLTSAAKLVREEGYLVYATCSLMRCENEAVVDAFLAQHPEYVRLSAQSRLAEAGYHLPDTAFTEQGALQLRPDLHGMDGFYAVLLQRQIEN
ncbi:MAG: RsmB/NOP family class I SAM-dependent RNA methyltransferase [Gammaproteobacteria bacterium]|nr:RsmB/NOP family class I SAM-dependent RNA methyltransferase [Gammaproteobacteria bacterium]